LHWKYGDCEWQDEGAQFEKIAYHPVCLSVSELPIGLFHFSVNFCSIFPDQLFRFNVFPFLFVRKGRCPDQILPLNDTSVDPFVGYIFIVPGIIQAVRRCFCNFFTGKQCYFGFRLGEYRVVKDFSPLCACFSYWPLFSFTDFPFLAFRQQFISLL
jgi:hypothetical protein